MQAAGRVKGLRELEEAGAYRSLCDQLCIIRFSCGLTRFVCIPYLHHRSGFALSILLSTLTSSLTAGVEAEDDLDTYERAQAKARAFDDWADGVPKGAGVTKRV